MSFEPTGFLPSFYRVLLRFFVLIRSMETAFYPFKDPQQLKWNLSGKNSTGGRFCNCETWWPFLFFLVSVIFLFFFFLVLRAIVSPRSDLSPFTVEGLSSHGCHRVLVFTEFLPGFPAFFFSSATQDSRLVTSFEQLLLFQLDCWWSISCFRFLFFLFFRWGCTGWVWPYWPPVCWSPTPPIRR